MTRLLPMLLLASMWASCRRSSPPGQGKPLLVAVGAEVTLSFGERCDDALNVCLEGGFSSLNGVTSDAPDVFGVGSRADSSATLSAQRVGLSRVTVDYVDSRGGRRAKDVWLEAKTLTHATVDVTCEQFQPTRALYAVTPSAKFYYQARGYAGDDELFTGTLPLFAAPDFALAVDSGGTTTATAPSSVGRYFWTLTGGATLEFAVYSPSDVTLLLNAETDTRRRVTTVRLEPSFQGASTCVHHGETRAVLQVTGGTCVPVVAGIELVGELPLDIGRGAVELKLEGDGPCNLSARLEGGSPVTTTAQVLTPLTSTPPLPRGTQLSPTDTVVPVMLPRGVACAGSLSDGKCSDIWDGDCYVDSDWKLIHRDLAPGPDGGTDVDVGRENIGVGLTTTLLLRVEIVTPPPLPNIVVGPPKNLKYETKHYVILDGKLKVEDLGCLATRFQVLALTPQASGPHSMTVTAENLNDVGGTGLDANDVAKASFRVYDGLKPTALSGPVDYFVGSTVVLSAQYQNGFNRTLRGAGPLQYRADVADAGSTVTDSGALFTGFSPHTITVSSPLAPQTQAVRVRDASSLVGVGNHLDTTLKVGTEKCVTQLTPLGPSGQRILGIPPVRPKLSLTGETLVLSRASSTTDGLCLRGAKSGTSTVRIDWGAASVSRQWVSSP